LVRLYWDIGRIIDRRQRQEGWGAGVIPRLADSLRNELPEVKGFSERNIKSMLAFHRAYSDPSAIVQQPAAQLAGKPIFHSLWRNWQHPQKCRCQRRSPTLSNKRLKTRTSSIS
jgi:hypothetical protein